MEKQAHQQGFSLLELIVVMTIIGFISFLVPPLMTSSIEHLKLRTTAKNIAASLRYAKTQAIAEKTPLFFIMDIKKNRYWLSSEGIPSESDKAEKIKLNKEKEIPQGIQVKGTMASTTYEENSSDSGNFFAIHFFQNGNSSGGKLTIHKKEGQSEEDKEDTRYYEITVDIFTGNITTEEFPKEWD